MEKEIVAKLQVIYDETGFDALLQNLLKIAQENNLSQKDAENLAKSFFDITAGGGDYFESCHIEFFEFIYQKFPKSKLLKNYLIDIYGILANEQNGDRYFAKMEQLIGNKPKNENAAITKAQTLKDKTWDELRVRGVEPDWDKCEKNINKIEEIFNWYPQNEHIGLVFADTLVNLTGKQDIEACIITIQRLEKLLEQAKINQFPKSSWFANRLVNGLTNLSKKQNEQESQKTINKIEEIVAQFPEESLVVMWLAYALETFSQYKRGKEREQIINRLIEISKIWKPAEKIAKEISNT